MTEISITKVAMMLETLSQGFSQRFNLNEQEVSRYLDDICQQKLPNDCCVVSGVTIKKSDKQQIVDLFDKLNKQWLESEYSLKWDKSRARFGRCVFKPREIYLSAHMLDVYGIEEMINTVKHEIAHACDHKYNGFSSMHGRPWKLWAIKLGAVPRARSGPIIVDKSGKWILRHIDTKEIYRSYHRKPRQIGFIPDSWIPNKKLKTLNKLEIVENV